MKALPRDTSVALASECAFARPTARQASPDNAFRLTVAGLVSRTLQFSVQDLRSNFSERVFTSRQEGRSATGHKSWRGCSLNEIIEFVGESGQARHIEFVCLQSESDGPFSIPIKELERQEIGLVWEDAGESLSAEEGGPLLALLPVLGGYQLLPGVSRINLVIVPRTSRSEPTLAA